MDKSDLMKLKKYLSCSGALDAQNADLIDDAIYQWDKNRYLAQKRLRALADHLERKGFREEANTVKRFY